MTTAKLETKPDDRYHARVLLLNIAPRLVLGSWLRERGQVNSTLPK